MPEVMQQLSALLIVLSMVLSQAGVSTKTILPDDEITPAADINVLCLPGVYLIQPADCIPAGPSLVLTSLARLGLYLPERPLPTQSPDTELSLMPATYVTARKESIPLFDSLAAAEAMSTSQTLSPGMKYLSIDQRLEHNNAIYYHLRAGGWVEGGSAGTGCCIYAGRFQGQLFQKTPTSNLGWFVEETRSRVAPSYTAAITGQHYYRENLVAVFDIRKVGDTEWLMIGPEEWVERRTLKRVLVNTTPPDGVFGDRWIEVNLDEQTLAVYDRRELVFATLIATGLDPFFTRPGLFQIQQKKELETMSGAFEADRSDYYYLEDVPWTMYYDQNRALHGAYWRTIFGYPQSHGCINLSPGDAHWLYDWASVGDWVYVWDPSGRTPTDPSYYGPGGA
ncbi:MAG: L,D-transpeptidase [Anaerolineaceae bacterium]|nr:L,D-transpeptidase [Anaerolineaceae bacterium]